VRCGAPRKLLKEEEARIYRPPYDPLCPTVCFEEKSLQMLADSRQGLPMQSGRPHRRDYEYVRQGTRNIFLFVEPHVGEFMGIAPTGKSITLTGILISRFVDGKVIEDWNNYDALGMLQQLGVIPAMR
jgi:SnoaL-like polyketide cyclase